MNVHVQPSTQRHADNAATWLKILARHRQLRMGRSAIELLITVVPFIGFTAIAYAAVIYGF